MSEDSRQIGELTQAVKTLTEDVRQIKGKVDNIEAQANRFRGAFAAILFLGGAIGWGIDKVIGWVAK